MGLKRFGARLLLLYEISTVLVMTRRCVLVDQHTRSFKLDRSGSRRLDFQCRCSRQLLSRNSLLGCQQV